MARLAYADSTHVEELLRLGGLPETTPSTNAFRIFAHAPVASAQTLRLVLSLLTETELNPGLREMVIMRVVQCCGCQYAWVQHAAIAWQEARLRYV
jgi:alkylhydroperoxidase family enzyme